MERYLSEIKIRGLSYVISSVFGAEGNELREDRKIGGNYTIMLSVNAWSAAIL